MNYLNYYKCYRRAEITLCRTFTGFDYPKRLRRGRFLNNDRRVSLMTNDLALRAAYVTTARKFPALAFTAESARFRINQQLIIGQPTVGLIAGEIAKIAQV